MEQFDAVGNQIKQAREESGLTIGELAEKANCSDEYLEWVEDGQVDPSVALLIQLAKAMRLDSGTFIPGRGSPSQRLEEATKRAKDYSYQTLTKPEADNHLMAFLVTIPPKTAHKGVGYQHEGEEFIYVLAGEVVVSVDEEEKQLSEKGFLHFNANLPHFLSNPGQMDTELLVILFIP